MKDTAVSTCEGRFLNNAVDEYVRLDGRGFDDYRKIEVNFGTDYGCVYVSLGETKCVAQVSCELAEPRFIRPNEGNVYINLEISDMVSCSFDTGQQTHLQAHANRLIEKCVKDSRCVDLEALCIISGEQVWEIRVDITVLNYDGNIHTCCSVATLAALAHFKTPYVSMENSKIIVHPTREFEPTPLSLHHFPILLSFAIFKNGAKAVLDPSELEEKVSEAELVIGMNSYSELCGMHFKGNTLAARDMILNSSHTGARVASEIIASIREKLEQEAQIRTAGKGKTPGLSQLINLDRILSACQDRHSLQLSASDVEKYAKKIQKMDLSKPESDEDSQSDLEETKYNRKKMMAVDKRKGVFLAPIEANKKKGLIPSSICDSWTAPNAEIDETIISDEDSSDDDVNFVKTITDEDRIIDKIELSGDSEEDDVVILSAKNVS